MKQFQGFFPVFSGVVLLDFSSCAVDRMTSHDTAEYRGRFDLSDVGPDSEPVSFDDDTEPKRLGILLCVY